MSLLLERLAEELAQDAVRQAEITGDEGLIDAVGKTLADTSVTFQETYLTAVRYLLANARARELLPSEGAIALPAPEPSEAASRPVSAEKDESPTAPEPAKDRVKSKPDEEIPYAEAEIVEDTKTETRTSAPHVGTGRLVPKPKVSSQGAENPSVEPEITGPRKSGR